jgi:hypothetical protein
MINTDALTPWLNEISDILWKTGNYKAEQKFSHAHCPEKNVMLSGLLEFTSLGKLFGHGLIISGKGNNELIFQGGWDSNGRANIMKLIWPWGQYEHDKKLLTIHPNITYNVIEVSIEPNSIVISLNANDKLILSYGESTSMSNALLHFKSGTLYFTPTTGKLLQFSGFTIPASHCSGVIFTGAHFPFQMDDKIFTFFLPDGNAISMPSVFAAIPMLCTGIIREIARSKPTVVPGVNLKMHVKPPISEVDYKSYTFNPQHCILLVKQKLVTEKRVLGDTNPSKEESAISKKPKNAAPEDEETMIEHVL